MHNYALILKNTDIFYKFTNAQLELVAKFCVEKTLNSGEIIFWEGSKSKELYIIVDGIVDILIDPVLVSEKSDETHELVTIATLRRGQSFGEIALVDQGLRSATARVAQNNTRLLIISRDEILDACKQQPELGYRLMFNLAADLALKIRNTGLRVREELLYANTQK